MRQPRQVCAVRSRLTTARQSPNFFAFFPSASSYPSILGEIYSATFAAAAFNWICSPATTELETIVLDVCCVAEAVFFPPALPPPLRCP